MRLSTISWGVFLVLCWSCFAAGKEHGEIGVSIGRKTVTLTCPDPSPQWFEGKGKKYSPKGNNRTLSLPEKKEVEGHFACTGSETGIRAVHLKVRVCDGCLELSLGLLAGIIVSDLLITLGVLLLVFYCQKNRVIRLGGGTARGGARGQPGGQKADSPPPVPNPDYEPIRKNQREVYAGLEPNRAF